uniref:Uncharacterized protein n=1 Tax=Rhizophora mucronata TaxID=61149 RepID=A0A2P2JEU4_RHIMU
MPTKKPNTTPRIVVTTRRTLSLVVFLLVPLQCMVPMLACPVGHRRGSNHILEIVLKQLRHASINLDNFVHSINTLLIQ